MIKTSEEIYYNGFSSKQFGVLNVNIDNAELVEPLFGNRTLNEERLKYKDESYFHNIIEDGKTFTLELAFDFYDNVEMTNSILRGVKSWLGGRQGFKSLWFSEDCFLDDNGNYDITKPRRIYKATVVETSNVTHFGLKEGYVTVTFKCNSGYCYSPIMGGRIWSEVANDDPDNQPKIYFGNYADMPIKPQIQITVGQKDPDDITDDPHNQSIKIIGEKIEDNQLPPITIDGFQRDYPFTPTDYTKFPIFEFSSGKKATGFFQLLDTIFFGEKFYLGNNNVYEFDLGMGKPFNKNETENILVPINDGVKAHNTLRFNDNSDITDGSTVTIGSDLNFEYDWDGNVSPMNIKTDISEYVANAKGILHLNSNLMPDNEMNVGDVHYTMIGSTNEEIVKITNHMLTDGTDANYIVRNNVRTLTQSNVNINTQTSENINQCLLLNVSKNPSDLGLRKMGYINKDFLLCEWNGESNEDYQQEINDVPISGSRLIITFDEPVNENTVSNDTIEIRNIEGNQIECTFGISKNDGGKTIYITPNTPFSYDTNYFIYVNRGVKNLKGNSFGVRKIKFHTKKENTTDDETIKNVSIVKVLNVYSSQKIDIDTITDSNVYVVKSGSSTHENVNINLIDDNKTINIYPKTKYDYSQSYELHVSSNIKDIDGNAIITAEKVIKFTTQAEINSNNTVIDDGFKIMTNVPIDKSIKVVLENKLDSNYINNNLPAGSEIVLKDKDGNNIDISISISPVADNILLVTPNKVLAYNSIYYMYVSQALRFDGGGNIQEALKYKIITIVNSSIVSNDTTKTVSETGDKSLLQNDFESPVNTDKSVVYNFGKALDTTTVNNTNVWVKDSKGTKVDCIVEPTTDESGIQIFPSPIWRSGESYSVFMNNQVKTTNKPRIFAGDVPADTNGDLGDYANVCKIFGNSFEIIKTNGFTINGVNVLDTNGNKVVFTNDDIIITTDTLSPTDYNSDGTIKNGTSITSIPARGIYIADATPITGKDRVGKYNHMMDYFNQMNKSGWETQSVKPDNTLLLTFSTKNVNEHIFISVDSSIILNNSNNIQNKIVKKIVNQRPNDNINLYHESDKDFCVDRDMLIPSSILQGARVFAGRSTEQVTGVKDDYENAQELLVPLGFDLVDLSTMTLADKAKIIFHEGDLILGGFLAGSKVTDFNPATGNLLTTPPTDGRKERVSGIPKEISVYPAKRLEGSANDCGRTGTRKAIENWVSLYKKAQSGGTLTDGNSSNLSLNGITVKYQVKKGSTVFATGADYYNGLKYLNGFGYEFVNIGLMSLAEKQAISFQEGDLILGGIGASDTTIDANGQKITITGIGAINIGKSKRIGGADRFETERLISEFAASLKVKTLETGDIIKLNITIDDASNNVKNTTSGTASDDTIKTTTINDSIKTEYHRIKSIKQLSRNRIFIEFEEYIRTTHYISEIEITDLYKLYNQKIAEDYGFTSPYQIKIGYDKKETMINIVKAINDKGLQGEEYSLRTFKHPIVLAQISSDSEIELDAILPGTQGNIPVSLIDKYDPLNRFLTPTLTGGKDCTQSDAIKALAKAILIQNDLPERYNKNQYTVEYDSNSLTITHKMYGKKYNNIICLANITQQYQTPYIITNNGTGISNANLINLQDYLTREKQIAKWENTTLIDGVNPKVDKIIEALKTKIDSVALDKDGKKMFNLTYILGDDGISRIGINIEYYKYGLEGNVPLNTTCVNGKLSSKRLSGGVDGLYVGEVITMDCTRKLITSSLGKDRMLNFNGNWLEVPLDGVKLVTKKGVFLIEFKYQEFYLI